MKIDKDVQLVLEDLHAIAEDGLTASDLHVGDQVYLHGDYGLYDTKYEVLEITDSHDEKINSDPDVSGAWNCYKPNEDAFAVVKLQVLTGDSAGTVRYIRADGQGYRDYDIIPAESVDAIDLQALDLIKLANDLQSAIASVGLPATGLVLKYEEAERGNRYGKLSLDSDNLVDLCGIWAFAVKDIRLQDFGGSYTQPLKRQLSISLNFRYNHIDGGSNGHRIGYAIYNFDTQSWSIEMLKD